VYQICNVHPEIWRQKLMRDAEGLKQASTDLYCVPPCKCSAAGSGNPSENSLWLTLITSFSCTSPLVQEKDAKISDWKINQINSTSLILSTTTKTPVCYPIRTHCFAVWWMSSALEPYRLLLKYSNTHDTI